MGKFINVHKYKISDFWMDERRNGKNFEIRKDDRESIPDVGDVVILESDVGRNCITKVEYVFKNADFLKDGYFLMVLKDMN